ncbi:hypothetical protein MRX96_027897 [Rhipicephalus microplus]
MFTPLLTFQIVACWVADTVGLGDCAWSPPGDLPVPIAPSSHLDQPRISSPIVSPLIPARACSYAWQRFSSSTSPTTWGQCGLHNLHNITKSSGHDTGWRKMFTPLLTFQIVACWVADTVGLGDCAWSPPGDLPVPIAPSSHLDQPRISSPIISPLIPARACSYAWQRFSSSTSPTTDLLSANKCVDGRSLAHIGVAHLRAVDNIDIRGSFIRNIDDEERLPCSIVIAASSSFQELKITSAMLEHNRGTTPEIFNSYPESRRFGRLEKEFVKPLLEIKVPLRLISQKLEENTGRLGLAAAYGSPRKGWLTPLPNSHSFQKTAGFTTDPSACADTPELSQAIRDIVIVKGHHSYQATKAANSGRTSLSANVEAEEIDTRHSCFDKIVAFKIADIMKG